MPTSIGDIRRSFFSYVQGYLDCMQLLSGLGVLNGVNQKWIDTFLKRYPMQRLK